MAGLYAIVGDVTRAWVMLEAGVPYLQLRFKESPLEDHRAEIASWPDKYPETRLIINDNLEFAQDTGAWGVHLGQEDLRSYSKKVLRQATVQLGISTHTDVEIDVAYRYNPALIGFGPIFPTSTKDMHQRPQGIYRLAEIVAKAPLPVVAIGGIDEENLESVLDTDVALVAMISSLDRMAGPDEVRALMSRIRRG